MQINWRSLFTYLLLILIGVLFIAPMFSPEAKSKEIPFSEFLTSIDKGELQDVSIAGDLISGTLKDKTRFHTRALNYPNLIPTLREKGVSIKVEPPIPAN